MTKKSKSNKIPSCIKLRYLCHSDLKEVKRLCHEWFPVEYPDIWYEDIINSAKFFSLAAISKRKIIGLIVAGNKTLAELNNEEKQILKELNDDKLSEVGYILNLGVCVERRRSGVASLLLDSYLQYLTTHKLHSIKVILLHVLTSNTSAINFYEKQGFRRRAFIPYYYTIHGEPEDAFSYVRYVNGRTEPISLLTYVLDTLSVWNMFWWPLRLISRFLTLGSQPTSSFSNKIL